MTERTEEIVELMDEVRDIVDGEPSVPEPTKRTLLEVWQHIFSNIEGSEKRAMNMQSSAQLISKYPFLEFKDVEPYLYEFNSRLIEMREVLEAEIALDPEAFKHVEDDAEHNHHHYLNLLTQWQVLLEEWEKEWHPSDGSAEIEFAAIMECHAFVLGQNGLLPHLDQIGFDLTEDENEAVIDAVMDAREV